jgi:hypothetical protein
MRKRREKTHPFLRKILPHKAGEALLMQWRYPAINHPAGGENRDFYFFATI